MGIAESIKRPVIVDREIPDVGPVRIRRLSIGGLAKMAQDQGDGRQRMTWLLRESVMDERGEPVFGSDDDVSTLDPRVAAAITTLITEVNRLDGDEDMLGVDDAKKGSPPPPSSA